MSRWARRRSPARAPARRAGRGSSPRTQPGQGLGQGPAPRILVEDHDGLLLLRLPTDDTLLPADVADLARALRAEDGDTVTVLTVAEGDAAPALWPRLSESLDSLREAGTHSIRLAMSGAGHDRPERPALARRIAEAWDMEVEAPDGPILVVPGGSVFVPPGNGGWWRFAPTKEPEALGPRTPAPGWQAAARRAPARTADGCVVDQIPAGLLIRPSEAAAPRPGDLFHAIPVDPRRPVVVVGVPWGEDIVATDVAEVLGALPSVVRTGVRLTPGGRRDLLPLGQSVADLLNAEVEVTTGLPLIVADRPLGTYRVRSVLVGPDGEPRWLPFVEAVMCRPAKEHESATPRPDTGGGAPAHRPAPAPRVLRWSSPVPDPGGTEDGVLRLSDAWQAKVIRAGLWVGSRDGTPPPSSLHPVSIEGPLVKVGSTGDRLDASLWPVLSRLLGQLAPDVRARTTLHVDATAPDGGRALRALAAEHALRVIRFAPSAHAARTTPRTVVGAAARTGGTVGAAVSQPVPVTGTAGNTVTVGSPGLSESGTATSTATDLDSSQTAPDLAAALTRGVPDPSEPRRTLATASGEAGQAGQAGQAGPAVPVAAPGRPATASAPEPEVSGPVAPSASEPIAEPTTEPETEPARISEGVTEAAGSEPVEPQGAAEPAEPASAPEAPRPQPVATGGAPAIPAESSAFDASAGPAPPARPEPAVRTEAGPAATPPRPAQATGPAPATTSPAGTPSGTGTDTERRPLPDVPASPRHRSTASDRDAFRALAEPVWERHRAAVNRALAGMPALRGQEQEVARIDLIALRMYLQDEEGPLSHAELTESLRAGEQRLVPYAGCLASGLGRLPSYRGVVLRGRGGAVDHGGLRPGMVLMEPAPLSGLPLDPAGKSRIAGVGFAIWSTTGRRVRQLLDGGDEGVFAPGTSFKVLDMRGEAAAPLVLMRQLPDIRVVSTVLEDADETALARLDHALSGRMAPGAGDWPDRCAGPVGDH